MSQNRRRRLAVVLATAVAAATLWASRDVTLSVIAGLAALLVLAFMLRRRRRRRVANSHVNADGSPKRAYASARAAQRAAADYEHDFGDHMNAYRCSRGRHWHIGHPR